MRLSEASFFSDGVFYSFTEVILIGNDDHIHKEIRSQDVRDIIKDLSNQVQ